MQFLFYSALSLTFYAVKKSQMETYRRVKVKAETPAVVTNTDNPHSVYWSSAGGRSSNSGTVVHHPSIYEASFMIFRENKHYGIIYAPALDWNGNNNP